VVDLETHRAKGCERKTRYATPAKVRKALRRASNFEYAMTSYSCEFCGGWHLAKVSGQRAPLVLILHKPGSRLP
jgi:hypothetical protein